MLELPRSAVSLASRQPAGFILSLQCSLTRRGDGGGGVYDMRQRFLLYLLEPSEMSGRVANHDDGGSYTEAEEGQTDGRGTTDLIS